MADYKLLTLDKGKEKKTRKLLSGLFIFVVFAALVVGCSSDGDSDQGDRERDLEGTVDALVDKLATAQGAASETTPQVTVIEKVVTPTPLAATEVHIPTPSLAPSLTPSFTPSPTITLSPLTLVEGDEWADKRVTLHLKEAKFNRVIVTVNKHEWAISFNFEFQNHSGGELLLRFDEDDFALADNIERDYPCSIQEGHRFYDEISKSLENNKSYKFWINCGYYQKFDKQVEFTMLSVAQFSSIPATKWTIEVPR